MSNVSENLSETAGEIAQDAAENAVETATHIMQNEVDDANARAERAEEVAEIITEAAIESERGRRIEELEGEVSECRTLLSAAQDAHESMTQEMASLRERLSALETVQTAPLIPLPLTQEVPPPSLTEEVAEALEEVTDPAAAEIVVDAAPEAEAPVVVRAKKRFIR